jgi:tRNA (cmo5U34)-methyltransferase
MMSTKDQYFKNPKTNENPFEFSSEVAHVFDDMVSRSVPGYSQIQDLIVGLILTNPGETISILDLGCSTGETLYRVNEKCKKTIEYRGIDKSTDMLEKAAIKCQSIPNAVFEYGDLNQGVTIGAPDIVIMNLTLQFIDKKNRLSLLSSIQQSLNENGYLILVEKVESDSTLLNQKFTNLYYSYKKSQGYSEEEITRKHQALNNVLNPLTSEANKQLVSLSGFSEQDVFYRWFNFEGRIALK